MGPDSTTNPIAHARRSARAVLENWNAGDLAQGAVCRAWLEESVVDLRVIEAHLRSGSAVAPEQLRSELMDFKREIAQVVRLVDAGLAFYSGVALRMGCSTPSYSPDGRFADESTTVGQLGMQA